MSVFWPNECLSSRGHKPLFVPFLLFSSNIFKNQKSKQKGEKEITSPILYDVILSSIELMRQPILYFTCFWILTNWKIIFDLRVYTHWAKIKIVMQKKDNATEWRDMGKWGCRCLSNCSVGTAGRKKISKSWLQARNNYL